LLPQSFNTPQYKKNVALSSRNFEHIDFPISYRYGINDASYPVFCVLEFDEDGIHHTALIRTTVQIVRSRNWFLRTRGYWLAGLPVILFGWIVAWRCGRAGRRKREPKQQAVNRGRRSEIGGQVSGARDRKA